MLVDSVLVEQLAQLLGVQVARVQVALETRAPELSEDQHQVDAQVDCPGDSGFQERKVQGRKAVRYSADEEALERHLVRLRKVTDAAVDDAGR